MEVKWFALVFGFFRQRHVQFGGESQAALVASRLSSSLDEVLLEWRAVDRLTCQRVAAMFIAVAADTN